MAAQLDQSEAKAALKARLPQEGGQLDQPKKRAAPTTGSQEIEKVTVYLPKQVYRFVKQTALEMEKRPHDLLMQGVELMLAQHGKSLKDFQK